MNTEVRYEGRTVRLKPGETVLEGLERAGVPVPSSCRSGVCQSCLMRAVEGRVPVKSQAGLKESLVRTGHFLACVCRPEVAITCETAHGSAFRGEAVIDSIREIGTDVVRVRFAMPDGFSFLPGQFVTFRRPDGLTRSYSLASPCEGAVTFDIHVRHIAGGRMSGWFHGQARPGDRLWMEGPKGDCTYYPGNPEEPLALIGTGTGVAPLFAIVVEALRQGHRGPIILYHGAVSEDRLYLVDELSTLAALHENFRYVRCLMRGAASSGIFIGDLKALLARELKGAVDHRAYLCGDPGLVRALKKQLFLGGLSLKRIHADPFIGTDAPSGAP